MQSGCQDFHGFNRWYCRRHNLRYLYHELLKTNHLKRVEPNIDPSLLVTNSFIANREKGLQLFDCAIICLITMNK